MKGIDKARRLSGPSKAPVRSGAKQVAFICILCTKLRFYFIFRQTGRIVNEPSLGAQIGGRISSGSAAIASGSDKLPGTQTDSKKHAF